MCVVRVRMVRNGPGWREEVSGDKAHACGGHESQAGGKNYAVHHFKSFPVFSVANVVETGVPELYIVTP